ncbi:MAG TPA: response regulator [Desulfobacteraceae bacterium]|nr:response regulator [Desulfobacteraceae bacterium]
MADMTGTGKGPILVVDDVPEVRKLITEALGALGYPCEEAVDGFEALDLIRRQHFDIVLCDIRMPGMDGLKVMTEARKIRTDIPFIILTGYDGEYSYDEVMAAGAQDLVIKPFTREELKTKLVRILKEWRLADENVHLLKEQVRLNKTLSTVLGVAKDLSSELDFDRLFPLIISKVTDVMGAERTSLYVIGREEGEVCTTVAEKVDEIRVPMGHGISGRVAETGEIINVVDAWELPYFDRSFDLKNNFRTRSVLCAPITNHSGERIAVIQVINKIGREGFDENDTDLLMSLASSAGIALENSFLMEELEASFEGAMETLAATVDARHPLTAGHSQRVTEYALLVAEEMNLSQDEQMVIRYAGLLHDIGKIGIHDSILLKDGPFTPEERAEMNDHPAKTRSMHQTFHFPRRLRQVPVVAAYHHERMDGHGYPYGLTGKNLPIGSKILAVADVFDALTSRRDYPKYTNGEMMGFEGMPSSKVIHILEADSGTHFDPEVVAAFLRCLPRALRRHRGNHFSPEYVDDMICFLESKNADRTDQRF